MIQRDLGFRPEPHGARLKVPVPGEPRQSGWARIHYALWQKAQLATLVCTPVTPAHGATAGVTIMGCVPCCTGGGGKGSKDTGNV